MNRWVGALAGYWGARRTARDPFAWETHARELGDELKRVRIDRAEARSLVIDAHDLLDPGKIRPPRSAVDEWRRRAEKWL